MRTNGRVIFVTAEEKLNDRDYDQMLPLIQEKIDEFEKVSLYFEMRHFKGWTPSAFWRDLKFGLSHSDDLEKVAIVGDKRWQEIMTQTMKPFADTEIKYFDESLADEAAEWIRHRSQQN